MRAADKSFLTEGFRIFIDNLKNFLYNIKIENTMGAERMIEPLDKAKFYNYIQNGISPYIVFDELIRKINEIIEKVNNEEKDE